MRSQLRSTGAREFLAGAARALQAGLRKHDEHLERRLALSERVHDLRLVPALSLLWPVSAVTAVRDHWLLSLVLGACFGLLVCCGMWWAGDLARRRRSGRDGGRTRGFRAMFVLAAVVALTACLLGVARIEEPAARSLWAAAADGRPVAAVLEVSGHPAAQERETDRSAGPACAQGCHFTAQLHRIRLVGTWQAYDGPVEVQCRSVCGGVRFGQELSVMIRVRERDGRPGQLTGSVLAAPRTLEAPSVFESMVGDLRRRFLFSSRTVPGEPGALLEGMVLGDRGRRTPEFTAVMTSTGLSHLTAVSGETDEFRDG